MTTCFSIEFHRGAYVEAHLPLLTQDDASPSVDTVLASAKVRASAMGADNIVIKDDVGHVVGVFSTFDYDMD